MFYPSICVLLIVVACSLVQQCNADTDSIMAGLKKALELKGNTGTVIDVGANGGGEMKASLDSGYEVIGIECAPRPYWHLMQMFQDHPKATVLSGCAGDAFGIFDLHMADDSSSMIKENAVFGAAEKRKHAKEKRKVYRVATYPLDDILSNINDIVLIKIDTQGSEFGVLNGAKKILAEQKPVIIYEFYMDRSEKALELLKTLNYSCVSVTAGDRMCTHSAQRMLLYNATA